jgi:hypothetical protein
VRVEMTSGERFTPMIEALFGLARLGHTGAKVCRVDAIEPGCWPSKSLEVNEDGLRHLPPSQGISHIRACQALYVGLLRGASKF